MADDVLESLKAVVFIFAIFVIIYGVSTIANAIRSLSFVSGFGVSLIEIFVVLLLVLVTYLKIRNVK